MTAGNSTTRLQLGPESVARVRHAVIGRQRECEVAVAALMSGRHLLLEGPPGTGKSTILHSIAESIGIDMDFVEGNAELTPARLVGHFDPAQVLEHGYGEKIWIDGPLTRALRHGHLLYLEEINRIPEETLNLLVTVMSEQELTIPRLGRVKAEPGFRLVAAMNPYDSIGTARISAAIYDRICRLAVDYQSVDDEVAITRRRSEDVAPTILTEMAVAAVRALRQHPEVRIGPSVRGSIDLVLLADGLATVRSVSIDEYELALDAALVALSGRLQLHDSTGADPEAIVTEVWADVWARFHPAPDIDDDGDPPADGSQGKVLSRKAADHS